jgi:predicted amidohydrolase
MDHKKHDSRRNFIKNSSLGLGTGLMGMHVPFLSNDHHVIKSKKLPREICVATMDLKDYKPVWPDKTREARVKRMIKRMDEVSNMKPDVVVLPETFDTIWVEEQKTLAEIAEDEKIPGPVTSQIAEYAKKNKCYVICPLITKKDDRFYNSSLLIDRKGSIAGVYHKTHPVKTEIFPDQAFKGGGVVPGAIDQPVFETDFGKVGMQICYDAYWSDGWDNLRDKGADIVFFSSAMPGGRILNHYASKNEYYIVSSTGGDARVIDKSGNDLDCTSDFIRWAWATINLNKVNADVWPANSLITGLYKKYGDRIGVRAWTTTDVITIESLDPNLNIRTALKEFDIQVFSEYIQNETEIHKKYRQENSKI